MAHHFFTLLLVFSFFTLNAQDLIERTKLGIEYIDNQVISVSDGLAKILEEKKRTSSSRNSSNYPLFQLKDQQVLPNDLTSGVMLDLQEDMLAAIRNQPNALLSLTIPVDRTNSFEVDLFLIDIYAPGFKLITSAPISEEVQHTGIFYHGIIRNNPNSAVALSIYEDMIDLFIQDPIGNYKLSKANGKEGYVLYNGVNRKKKGELTCAAKGGAYKEETVREPLAQSRSVAPGVPVYIEADYELFLAKNRDLNAMNRFVEIMIVETTALYARLEIPITVSGLKLYNSPDDYPLTGINDDKLTAFAETLKDEFPGVLAHLLTGEDGGGIANLGVLCATYAQEGIEGPYAVTGIGEPNAETPDLDDINTFAHELGHNFGSYHTQACFWNGNNTAIDGCVSPEAPDDGEPTCDRPNTDCPVGGGTIMSYCTTPEDPLEDCVANNNWHPQVAAYIKSKFAEATNAGCTEEVTIANSDDTEDTSGTGDDTNTGGEMDTNDAVSTLEMEILSQMEENNIPSLSIGVLSCKELSYSKGFGNYDIANEKQATDETIYTLASLTKVVTATAIFHLMETGAFELDDAINNYLPYEIVHPDHPDTPITFRMLLQHTSGIIDNDVIYTGYSDGDHPESLSDFVYRFLNPDGANYEVSENFSEYQPGANYEYSNTGITVLGYLVEVISEMPFNEYCNVHLFTPMDMNNTRFFLSELNIQNLAIPYSWDEYEESYESYGQYGIPDYPNGLLRSTIKDMSNFFSMYLNNGTYKGKKILTPESIEILTPMNAEKGHTWFNSDDIMPNSEKAWGHSGFERGVSTIGVFENNRNGAVIILTNGEYENLEELSFWSDLWEMAMDCNNSMTEEEEDIADNTGDNDDTRGGGGGGNTSDNNTPETCDCLLDTVGVAAYINTLDFDENDPLVFAVPDATSKFAVLYGTIGSDTPEKAQALVNNFPNVTTLVFLSIPGSGDDEANLSAARILRAKGYTSYLPAVQAYPLDAFIASGGVDLFLSGTTRIIDEGGEVGVHAWADGDGKMATDFDPGDQVHQLYIDYYVEMGFSQADAAAFYFFTINAAPSADIYNMKENEIEQYKLRTCKRPDSCDNNDGTDGGGGSSDGDNTDSGDDTDGGDSTDGADGNTGNQEMAQWTMLIYLNGSDLESKNNAGTNDLAEMMAAGNTENVNIIVLTGGAKKEGWETLKSWKIENGKQVPLTFQAVDQNMSNPQNLTNFINWGIDNYPAEKYMLDLWNHGMDIRGYGHDENTDKEIKIPQLKEAIANSGFIQAGNRFELLGFDACLMATIEVQATLANFTNYFVASEETEPGHGWNYTPVISAMNNNMAQDGAKLGVVIADSFKAQAIAEETENVTLSVVNAAQIPLVVQALENLSQAIKNDGQASMRSLQKARSKAEEYSTSIQNPAESEDMVDIGDLMKNLKKADPFLSAVADNVITAINNAVVYSVNDQTRPNATGISMFIPHNKLEDEEVVYEAMQSHYNPIDFSASVKSFVGEDYLNFALGDDRPPSGEAYDDGITLRGHHSSSRSRNPNSVFSSVRVSNTDDLEEVRVVLEATSFLGEDEFVLLGSTFPDTCYYLEDGSEVFGYQWDEYWLGINGYPAYIADIYEYEVENEQGDTIYMTRVQIPAVLNPNDPEVDKDIILSYVFDDDFNIKLENIVPETYGEEVLLTAKERITLQVGDQIQLLYEGFNEATDEEFYVVDDEAIFDIVNGEEDLSLDYDWVEEGDYILGYLLTDYSQNDTIIYDPKTFSVVSSTVESFAANNIELLPNPTTGNVTINYPAFTGGTYRVELYDLAGQLSYQQVFDAARVNLAVGDLSNGYYLVKLISEDQIFSDKVIILK